MLGKILLALLVIGTGVLMYLMGARGMVSGDEARALVTVGARLVDVRTSGEFEGGHLSGALNIPVDELVDRIAEVGDPSTVVVVYCRSGSRSRRAQRLLKERGFEQVHNLGGMHRW